jgi:hypothetical protein
MTHTAARMFQEFLLSISKLRTRSDRDELNKLERQVVADQNELRLAGSVILDLDCGFN